MSDGFFSDEEMNSLAYKLCVGGFAVGGLAAGSITAGAAALPSGGASLLLMGVGLAGGVALGKNMCSSLSEQALRKLRSPYARVTPMEMRSLVQDVLRTTPGLSRQAALEQLARLRLQSRSGLRA